MPSYFIHLQVAWVVIWLGGSVLYRKRKGRPIFPKPPEGARFSDTSGSGRSHQSWLSRLGGARNCLLVALTERELIVQPKFPFTLAFLPEIFGMEFTVPRRHVRVVSDKQTLVGRVLTLRYTAPDGEERSFDLSLRDVDQFLAVLNAP